MRGNKLEFKYEVLNNKYLEQLKLRKDINKKLHKIKYDIKQLRRNIVISWQDLNSPIRTIYDKELKISYPLDLRLYNGKEWVFKNLDHIQEYSEHLFINIPCIDKLIKLYNSRNHWREELLKLNHLLDDEYNFKSKFGYLTNSICSRCKKEDGDVRENPFQKDMNDISVMETLCSYCYSDIQGDI